MSIHRIVSGVVLAWWLAIVCVALVGCATASLPGNATPAEKREAMCLDARRGLALGQIGVSTAVGPDQVTYWQRWLEGARQGIELYCGVAP